MLVAPLPSLLLSVTGFSYVPVITSPAPSLAVTVNDCGEPSAVPIVPLGKPLTTKLAGTPSSVTPIVFALPAVIVNGAFLAVE